MNRDSKGRFCKANPESKTKIPNLKIEDCKKDRVNKIMEETNEPIFVHISFNPEQIQNVSIVDSIVELLHCILGD